MALKMKVYLKQHTISIGKRKIYCPSVILKECVLLFSLLLHVEYAQGDGEGAEGEMVHRAIWKCHGLRDKELWEKVIAKCMPCDQLLGTEDAPQAEPGSGRGLTFSLPRLHCGGGGRAEHTGG